MRHVRDFGAVGDGTTDDTDAVQKLLDDGPGGCSIEGVDLLITRPLIIRGGRRLVAYGAKVTGAGGHTLLRNFDIDADSFPGYDGNGDIAVYGGFWDARGDLALPDGPHAGTAWNAITFCHARRITVRDAEIVRVAGYHALEYNSVAQGVIDNCVARGFTDSLGTRQFSEAIQIDVALERSADIGLWDGTHSRDVHIVHCHAGPALDGTMGPFGALVGSHTRAGEGHYEGIHIRDCTVDGSLRYGVRAYAWKDPVIQGNTIDAPGANGVMLEKGTGGTVSGNMITDAGSNAVNVTGQPGVIVAGNGIRGTGSNHGVYLSNTTGSVVSGNRVEAAAVAGVRLSTGADQCLVEGNVLAKGASASNTAVSCGAGEGTENSVFHNHIAGYSGSQIVKVDSGTVHLSPVAGAPGANVV